MKKVLFFLISLLFACASLAAQKVSVTFQVNMNDAEDLHPGGSVWLLFGDWAQWWYMDDSDADGIYTFTVDTTVSHTINYSFSYQTGPDEWNDYTQETVPENCAGAEGYREVLVPEKDTILPAFFYEKCSDKFMSEVTVSVNLKGRTDVYADGGVWVYSETDWSDWADMSDEDGDSVYTAKITREVGSTLNYIFSYQTGPDAWNDYTWETVPGACAQADGFREILVPEKDTVLPVFDYEDCTGNNTVNFRVDLSGVSDLYDGGSVWVLLGDWVEYYYMEDADGDMIYTYALQTAADTAVPYKFSYQTGPDEWTNYVVETVPEECANAEGYREVTVIDGYMVLLPVAYGSCDATPPATVNITFSVDMSNETVENNDVQVVIKDPWIWTALVDQGSGIWSATVEVNANATYPYTFVNGGVDNWSGEEKLPDECNMGTPGAPERHVTVTDSDMILDLVAFGSCDDNPVGQVNVTFSVDMSRETVSGEGVQLVIKGPWIWTAMTDMGNGIWETTLLLNQNSTYPFTYVNGAKDDWGGEESVPEACNFGSASSPERQLQLGENDTIMETVSFGACDQLSDVNVTFRVDMKDETVSGDGVQVVLKDPWIWTAMTDEGNGIWSATVELTGSTTYPYSFVNGAKDYWAGEEVISGDCKDGDNNQRLVEVGGSDTTLTAYIFGTCEERTTSIGKLDIQELRIYPNPANDRLTIELRDQEISRVSVFDATGRKVLDRNTDLSESMVLDVNSLSGGIYLLVVEGSYIRSVTRIAIQE